MVVRKCCGLVCELQTLSSSKVISHMPTTKIHIYWLREQQHNSDDSANVACLFYCHCLFDALLAASVIIVLTSKLLSFQIYLQGPEGMLMLRRHLSYLQKEGTRPSSCLVAVSSFDSFVQQRGDLAFFMSRAKRVIDTDYDSLVGVVLFNHLEVDFDVKPNDRAARMIVHVITMPDVAEVEDLDAIFWREGGFGSSDV
ncbi:deoxyuridine 5'-triphosphate nucleotidohydrolase isoform X2 [Triticum aestivum]|uniref:dUTP diphosphatase n=1 Tax=Triticum aestivum TaxID=4565 RepID=A0A3B6PTH1_WHEAT|nr:deoxyuridine 5'-triphosphate nucleotidohydrolase-like isoform X2 [Triticum aestivum]